MIVLIGDFGSGQSWIDSESRLAPTLVQSASIVYNFVLLFVDFEIFLKVNKR
jgi:hypothetical protein